MADRKITELTALAAGSQATGDLLTIVDVSETAAADKNKKITVESLFQGIPANVGIGTASPATQLHVAGSSVNSVLRLAGNSSTAYGEIEGDNVGNLLFHADPNDAANSTTIRFRVDDSERMRIDSSGRVGIGTTSADSNLVVKGASGDVEFKLLTHNGVSQSRILFADNTAVDGVITYDHNDRKLLIGAGTSTPTDGDLTIDSSGNVGIGTSGPHNNAGTNLHIHGSNTTAELRLTNTTTGAGANGSSIQQGGNTLYVSNSEAGNIAFENNGSERMRIDSSGRVGIGNSSMFQYLEVAFTDNDATFQSSGSSGDYGNGSRGILIENKSNTTGSKALIQFRNDSNDYFIGTENTSSGSKVIFKRENDDPDLTIDSSGNVGIGTSSPSNKLDVNGSISASGALANTGYAPAVHIGLTGSNPTIASGNNVSSTFRPLIFTRDTSNATAESMRIDSSGNLFIGGTTASSADIALNADGSITAAGTLNIGDIASSTGGTRINSGANTVIRPADSLAGTAAIFEIYSGGLASTNVTAQILKDGSSSFKGSITADGAIQSNATSNEFKFLVTSTDGSGSKFGVRGNGEVRIGPNVTTNNAGAVLTQLKDDGSITAAGTLLIGKTTDSFTTAGVVIRSNGETNITRSGSECMNLNRESNDGDLIRFRQANNVEGSVSVSGSTVSYNGAHLSRWSQLPGGVERTEILRGSVLSNLDEMCEWAYPAQDAVLYTDKDELPDGASVGDVKTPAVSAGKEDNEQLNRMKVSDTEGDKNVSGVFQAWDDDDDTYTNDFYCAMTGDFVIRIAQGTTVARGDLLMSAGDGTAKPQDDDIVRSKTIAKVTSTTVSETYSDGSYCVPCVLMAC